MCKFPLSFMKNLKFFKSMLFSFIIVFMTVTLSGCFLWPVQEEMPKPPLVKPEEVSLPLTTAVRGPIEDAIRGSAYYQPTIMQAVALKGQSGKITKIYMKEGERVNKGDLILELDSGNLEDSLYYQRINHEKAQIAYDRLKERSDIEGGGYKYDLRLAEINLEVETKKLNELETKYEATRVYSPVSGVFNYVRKMKVEDTISDGTIIAHVCDPESGALEYSNISNAGAFKLGQLVEVSYTANKQTFTYQCPVIGTPETQPEDSNKKNTVTIDASTITNLKFGDRVSIKLVVKSNDNAILVPRSVIREMQGDKFVYVLEDGMKTQRLVEVGITTSTQAEIVDGLEPGEQVFTR